MAVRNPTPHTVPAAQLPQQRGLPAESPALPQVLPGLSGQLLQSPALAPLKLLHGHTTILAGFPIRGAQGCREAWLPHVQWGLPCRHPQSLLGLPVQAVLPSPSVPVQTDPTGGCAVRGVSPALTLTASQAHRSIFCSAKQEAALPHFRGFTVRTKTVST